MGFALEYSLGHVTHAQNLKSSITKESSIVPTYVELDYHNRSEAWKRLPGIRSNWSLRASLGAYRGLAPQIGKLQAILFHTQVTSLLSTRLMKRVPALISLDATPLQYDALGSHYGHHPGNGRVEEWKKWMNWRAFHAARHLITWSEWAKASLVQDYGVPRDKVTVIPPGIDTETWDFRMIQGLRTEERATARDTNFLFVGGDFARKGGDTLLEAFCRLPSNLPARLTLVTTSDISAEVNEARRRTGRTIDVWNGLQPNSLELRQRFAGADVFVFPSRADCLPLAVMEALASGLPVVTTAVGALNEAVDNGACGLIVPPSDVVALAGAMETIAQDREQRNRMAQHAREIAVERFNAARNYRRLVATIEAYAK